MSTRAIYLHRGGTRLARTGPQLTCARRRASKQSTVALAAQQHFLAVVRSGKCVVVIALSRSRRPFRVVFSPVYVRRPLISRRESESPRLLRECSTYERDDVVDGEVLVGRAAERWVKGVHKRKTNARCADCQTRRRGHFAQCPCQPPPRSPPPPPNRFLLYRERKQTRFTTSRSTAFRDDASPFFQSFFSNRHENRERERSVNKICPTFARHWRVQHRGRMTSAYPIIRRRVTCLWKLARLN